MTVRARLRLPPAVRRAIVAHARAEAPRECCGLLLGTRTGVTHAARMANTAPGVSRYRVDDAAHIGLRRLLRTLAPPLEVVGVYHSHPDGPAVPSPADVAEAFYPEWVHVIVGLGRPRAEVRAFRIRRGRARELRLSAS